MERQEEEEERRRRAQEKTKRSKTSKKNPLTWARLPEDPLSAHGSPTPDQQLQHGTRSGPRLRGTGCGQRLGSREAEQIGPGAQKLDGVLVAEELDALLSHDGVSPRDVALFFRGAHGEGDGEERVGGRGLGRGLRLF